MDAFISLDELRLGQTAVMQQLCTQLEVDQALARKRELSLSGEDKELGALLVKMGFLTKGQLRRLNELQKTADKDATVIGRYRLLDKIGEGGMGSVYRVEELNTGEIFALKVLQKELVRDETFVERFDQEVRAAFSLDNPNIVKAYDVGQDGRYHYLVMEYVEGKDAFEILEKRGKMQEKEALGICRQVASALQCIHEAGLVHRDIKPENILVMPNGTVKLTDLGLAIKGEAKLRRRLTATGVAMGTPAYLSPEQILGEDLDIRSDLYGLGATLYELVTGKCPFEGDSAQNVMKRHLEDSVPSPRDVDHRISNALCHIVEKLMAKDRNDRYKMPYEVMLDIDMALSEKPLASERVQRGLSTVRRPRKKDRATDEMPGKREIKSPSQILRDTMRRHRVDPDGIPGKLWSDMFLGRYGRAVFWVTVIWLLLISVSIAALLVKVLSS